MENNFSVRSLFVPRRLYFCVWAFLASVGLAKAMRSESADDIPELRIDWNSVQRELKTTASLQVVVNPQLLPDSPIHRQIFQSLVDLRAEYVRYVPWLPYPKLAVAELLPPVDGKTSWDFTQIDPTMVEFMQSSGDRPVMVNFSTIPAWLFKTDKPVSFPADPGQVTWSYTQGTELREGGLRDLGDYYGRLVSWYVKGGFVDETGKQHTSLHRFKIHYWEVFNEPDLEYQMTPLQYTERYDAVVGAIRKVSPDTKFVGLSLSGPSQFPEMFEYFLNPANHAPGIPLDMISYHFYAMPDKAQTVDHWQYTFFDQADRFIVTARYIDSIRRRLSPETKVALNEVGSILPADLESLAGNSKADAEPNIPHEYWNLSGAMFAYIYMEGAKLGIDIISCSQLVGYPTQFPSVTMLDWKTGVPNARYWVLKLLRDNFSPGDLLVGAPENAGLPEVAAQAFRTSGGKQKVLLINRRNCVRSVKLFGSGASGTIQTVDENTKTRIAEKSRWDGGVIQLAPFAVSIVELDAAPKVEK